MTTIAYDGKMIAADTRVSTTVERRDNSNKIHVMKEEVFFREQKILVVGTSGNVRLSRYALQALKDDGDKFVDFYIKVSQRGLENEARTFSLLIVCTENAFVFSYKGKGPKLEKITKPYSAIGSGAPVANFLLGQYNVPADLAVAGASTTDPATGHLVQHIRMDSNTITKAKDKHYPTRAGIANKIRDHIVKAHDES